MSHLEFMFQYTEAKVNTVQRQICIPDFNPITDNWAKWAKFKTRLKETYKLLYYAGEFYSKIYRVGGVKNHGNWVCSIASTEYILI